MTEMRPPPERKKSPDGKPLYTRREAMAIGGSFVAAGLLGAVGGATHATLENRRRREDASARNTPEVFSDSDTEALARLKGITPETFVNVHSESAQSVLAHATAFKNEEMYPVFSPSVAQHEQYCRDLGEQFDIPPNFIMAIMQQESAGNTDAQSEGAYAQGVFQVMPAHFNAFEGIEGEYSFEVPTEPTAHDKTIMRDPIVNGTFAMRVLGDCLAKARVIAPGDTAETFLLAAQGYNGGESRMTVPYDELPRETKMYRENIARFFIAMEVADGLRSQGKTHTEIVEKMSSQELDARFFALMRWFQQKSGGYKYSEYKAKYTELSEPQPTDGNYKGFAKEKPWTYPLNPALRGWFVTTGGALYENSLLDHLNFAPVTEWVTLAGQTEK